MILYSNGEQIEVPDNTPMYEPFPEQPKESTNDQEESQNSQSV